MIPLNTKILICDDMATIRDLVKANLKSFGFTAVIEAENGEDALNLLIQHDSSDTKVGLVIADWKMPKMSGLEFLKQVRASEHWSNLPFVLLTSEAERDQVTEAILSGVSQYVVKPFAAKGFEEKLKSAWAKHHKK